ncbi:hypothetical protein ACHQM5_027528 [Ranunculus cassubicifolius]
MCFNKSSVQKKFSSNYFIFNSISYHYHSLLPSLLLKSMEFCIASSRISTPRSQIANLGDTPQEGKLLSMLMRKKHNFYHIAVSKQLHALVSAREEAAARKNQMESLLHRRIAESILHEFSDAGISMVPKLSEYISNNTLPIWPSKRRELVSIHSLEMQEMIKEHVINILRMREECNSTDGVTKIDRIHIGRIYALAVMYGYFLKSACLRHQLESCIASSPGDLSRESTRTFSMYIKGFDSESLQRCAKLKTKEAINVVEKHTWGLFGDENIDLVDGDNNIDVTSASMERLALEAVTFGSFLWDVEKLVDSVCRLKSN